ncbi:flagellar hook assembly protein FlgD [Rhodocyclus tenuis]|uniref:Basal-body rod modification protein FlgD n=1 Tax=Rhodocyclus tenuis TaxID=1066 RepID=A0A840G6W3_RHOTE|nr:flagellar hook assembly protein FlgD [Rhodocyclus tenuis]MBB4246700.1 flagellar basal-body rod modification protein FlgD [Rhodocyclus tenuis]MBK1679995.1 flagellar biosynthesis protein FlgD [Rhodocyclus tenuis]
MASVSSTSSSSLAETYAALNGSSSTSKKSDMEAAQDRFLTLLVTQLQNQDPLNPLDNSEVTTQLAQINTVTGIEKLNSTLTELFDIYDQGQSMQAAGMIGKNVLVEGKNIALSEGAAVAGIDLAKSADKVTVSVLDSSGNIVYQEDLGSRKAGSFVFGWDGSTTSGGTKAKDGNYTFKVEATTAGTAVGATALQLGYVYAVVRNSSGFTLDLGSAGNVAYSAVKQIL